MNSVRFKNKHFCYHLKENTMEDNYTTKDGISTLVHKKCLLISSLRFQNIIILFCCWCLEFIHILVIIKALLLGWHVCDKKGGKKISKLQKKKVPLKCPLKRLQGSQHSYTSLRNQSSLRKCYLQLVLCMFSRNKWCNCPIIEPSWSLEAAVSVTLI